MYAFNDSHKPLYSECVIKLYALLGMNRNRSLFVWNLLHSSKLELSTKVRLKYDDTYSDQEFSEIDTIFPHRLGTPT